MSVDFILAIQTFHFIEFNGQRLELYEFVHRFIWLNIWVNQREREREIERT